ncbi:universal stress protein Slr1101-like [Gigantopelta aegis]|uniref:universal stress protein Slr1101-like n=1 Tax=Gigantopelta aegis TaxID=1735272 RepID=UPI001B8884EB|nr:universal stress protein Slr1101-like [Gigantopelta aegis]
MAAAQQEHDGLAVPPGSRVVVIGVDGSPFANYAFDWYVDNVRSDNDYVVLVNSPEMGEIVKSSWNSSLYTYDKDLLTKMLDEEQKAINNHLKYYRDKLLQIGAKGKVKLISAKEPGQAICKAALEEHAEFIVVGTRGLGKIRRTITGSVSDYVLHHSNVPVLVCKSPELHKK